MARKSAAVLKSQPVKLSPADKKFLADIAMREPVEGCEEQWGRYLNAATKYAEATARYDMIYNQVEKEGGTSSCQSWAAFVALGHDYDIAARGVFGALDAYLYSVKHLHDDKFTPEDELRAVITDTLSDKTDVLQWNLKSTGLLGSKVAQAIKHDALEGSAGQPPLCADCSTN